MDPLTPGTGFYIDIRMSLSLDIGIMCNPMHENKFQYTELVTYIGLVIYFWLFCTPLSDHCNPALSFCNTQGDAENKQHVATNDVQDKQKQRIHSTCCKELKQISKTPKICNARSVDEEKETLSKSTDSGFSVDNIREDNKSITVSTHSRQTLKPFKDENSNDSLESAESGIYDCTIKSEEIEYEFNSLMSNTIDNDENCKDISMEYPDANQTSLKTHWKAKPPRQSLSVYIKSEDIFQHISKKSEDYEGLLLQQSSENSFQSTLLQCCDAQGIASNPNSPRKDSPIYTSCIDTHSERNGTDISIHLCGTLPIENVGSPTWMENYCQKPKVVSDELNSYEFISRESLVLVNNSFTTFDLCWNSPFSRQPSSLYGMSRRKSLHVKAKKLHTRRSRIHGNTLKQTSRMHVSRLAMSRFFKNFELRSKVKKVLPYRKCALRYNTSYRMPSELWTTANEEQIALPFLNQNEVPALDSCALIGTNQQHGVESPEHGIYECQKETFYAISVGSVAEISIYEWGRLKTFSSFPMDCPIRPITLAKYGFYYTGNRDEVVCFSCSVSHCNWKKGDSVYAVHYLISKRCRFMLGDDVGNVPIHRPIDYPSHRAGGRDGFVGVNAEETSQISILATPETVTSLFLELEVNNSPNEMRNGLESSGRSIFSLQGLQTATSTGSSASQATAASAQDTPSLLAACLTPSALTSQQRQEAVGQQNQVSSAIPIATGSLTATTNSSTPTANNVPSGNPGNQARTGNQQQPMSQQHPTTLAQRQQLRLEQQQHHGHQQQEQRQHRSAIADSNATNNSQGATTARPRYPNYSLTAVRSATFNGFPNHLDQTPLEMARAGFFYAGYGDYVRCFFCGGGLRNWEPGDDPWVEHARWFPRCTHVRQNKGQTFINLVLQRQRELTLPNEYINTAGQASNVDSNVPSVVQTARIQTNNDQQSSASNTQSMTQTGLNTDTKVTSSTQNSTASASRPSVNRDQVVTQRAVSADDMNSPAVLSVKNMGYGDQIIQAAVQRLRHNQGPVELTAMALLEIIFSRGDEEIPPETADQMRTGSHNTQVQNAGLPNENTNVENTSDPQTANQRLIPILGLRGHSASSYTEEELQSIREENNKLKEQMKCKICMDDVVCISFLPCGHLCCCAECAPAMVKCPICRQIIRGSVKTYLS